MRIHIESGGLADAHDSCRTANQISALLCDSLASKLSGFAGMAGDDSTSVEFAADYDSGAREALATLTELTHAFIGLGRLLASTGANHRSAEEASASVKAFTQTSHSDDDFVRISPPSPPSSLGANPPQLGVVEAFILDHVEGFVWPGADVELLLEAASTWRRTAESVRNLDTYCDLAVTFLERQISPEIPLALAAIDELSGLIRDTADELAAMATSCEEYADAVRATHQRTLDLLGEIGRMIVEGAAISLIVGGLTGGLAAGAAGTAAIARITAQAPRFHALLTTLRITGTTSATRLRTAREGLGVARSRFETFARVRVRNERGEIRLPGVSGGGRTPGWLRSHEIPPGHTMSKHVGKTVDELIEQCAKDNKHFASSFANEADAEKHVANVIKVHRDEVEAWLASDSRRSLPLEADLGQITGTTVSKAGDVTVPTGVRVVLIRNPDTKDGWQLLTAFPN